MSDVNQLERDTLRQARDLLAEGLRLRSAEPGQEPTAPILDEAALSTPAGQDAYLIGLIGGKNVGKSSLVNALVGAEITARTSHGVGTDRVVAYVHASREAWLQALLEREVPGRYTIATHQMPDLQRQVLLDLPDFDSHYEAHVEITRRMLRHMLYPLWLQSVEKYADRQPRELLARVAGGNAPRNFVFCLNKIDQLIAREGEEAAREVGADYARRIAEVLALPVPPDVFLVSARYPDRWDLPRLRELLSRQRSEAAVQESRKLALRHQAASVLGRIDALGFAEEAMRLRRLESRAREQLSERVGLPLLETAIPRLMEDARLREATADEVFRVRIARWPIVSAISSVLEPAIRALHGRGGRDAGPAAAIEPLVAAHAAVDGRELSDRIQAAFAHLQQSSPELARIYGGRRLWEPVEAQAAATDLRHRLTSAIERRRTALVQRMTRSGPLSWIARMALTLGAAIWFPLLQPVLDGFLIDPSRLVQVVVTVLSGEYLLENVGFLLVWFALLWVMVRWRVRRGVESAVRQWQRGETPDADGSLPATVVAWSERLLDPIRTARQRAEELVRRGDEIRRGLSEPEKPAALAS